MAPPSKSLIRLVLGPVLVCAALGCFDSDELRSGNVDEGSSSSDTVTPYSDETADGGDDNWTAEETGPSETTCRDAIDCLVMCQAELIINPMSEPDLECFLECDANLSTEEAYKLIKLAECIGNVCADNGSCGPEGTDSMCLICIAAYGQDPQPPGCLEEAAACE